MRVLLVEDEELTAAVLLGSLTSMGHQVTVAADGLSAWQILQDEHFPLLLSDWMMPGMDGPALCRRIRAVNNAPYTYIILLSALDRHEDQMEGLRAGADDFIVKPAAADELALRLDIAGRILDTQAKLERQNARLEALATTDDLTGLKNRRQFFQDLNTHFAQTAIGQSPLSVTGSIYSTRRWAPLSLILLDVDHFKAYNDEFGHPAGDDILRGVANVLRGGSRDYDTVARHGGEEFAILLPDAD
jgi:two-component system cell cycle response regulator